MKDEIWTIDMPAEEYHAVDAINGSSLKYAAVGLDVYEHSQTTEFAPSRAMQIGSAVHALLEGQSGKIANLEVGTRTAKAYKEARAEDPDGIILVGDELEVARGCAYQLEKRWTEYAMDKGIGDSLARQFSDHRDMWALDEPSLFVKDLKARPDRWIWGDGRTFSVNWKTTTSAVERDFRHHFYRFGYHLSVGHYAIAYREAGYTGTAFVFPVVETKAPYHVVIYEIDPLQVEVFIEEAEELHEKIRQAREIDVWTEPAKVVVL